jgi:hypothetical protein
MRILGIIAVVLLAFTVWTLQQNIYWRDAVISSLRDQVRAAEAACVIEETVPVPTVRADCTAGCR